MTTNLRSPRTGGFCGRTASIAAAAALLFATACDLTVSNPGPVADEFLNDPGAHEAVLAGLSWGVSETLWKVSLLGTETTFEQTRAGRNYSGGGLKTPDLVGNLTRNGMSDAYYSAGQRARWMAEDASRRFAEVTDDPASFAPNAWAKLYAGIANRLLGENFCNAVIDGGAPEPHTVYFDRAIAAFNEAIEIGGRAGVPTVVTAARAGLAQIQGPWLGQWQAAVANAQQVPLDFRFQAIFYLGLADDFNQIVYITDGDAWRDLTTYETWYRDYYLETGDPRVRSEDTGRVDTPARLPLIRQRKWTQLDDDMNLASGREMVLIQAEAALTAGAWQEAMILINSLRQGLVSDHDGSPVPLHSASGLAEAWTALKDERKVEFWLEGRRMSDLRRWIATSTPGEMEDMRSRVRLCVPISQTELVNNVNVPLDFQDPVNPIYTGS